MIRFAILNSTSHSVLSLMATERLGKSSHTALRSVACEEHDGVLTLRGRVASFHLKQLATSIVSKISGVDEIVNQIVVIDCLHRPEALDAAGPSSRPRPR